MFAWRIPILIGICEDADLQQGRYIVQADVYSKDDEHITCLTATVYFKPKPIGRPPLGNLLGGDL